LQVVEEARTKKLLLRFDSSSTTAPPRRDEEDAAAEDGAGVRVREGGQGGRGRGAALQGAVPDPQGAGGVGPGGGAGEGEDRRPAEEAQARRAGCQGACLPDRAEAAPRAVVRRAGSVIDALFFSHHIRGETLVFFRFGFGCSCVAWIQANR
jgi:hypothetical protein